MANDNSIDTQAEATKSAQLYKVLSSEGKPANGGRYDYSLPTRREDGSYSPGAWTEPVFDPRMCHRGYHLTARRGVLFWSICTDLPETVVYTAEPQLYSDYDGMFPDEADENDPEFKMAFEQVRLLRPVMNLHQFQALLCDLAEWILDKQRKLNVRGALPKEADRLIELSRKLVVTDEEREEAGGLAEALLLWNKSTGSNWFPEDVFTKAALNMLQRLATDFDPDGHHPNQLNNIQRLTGWWGNEQQFIQAGFYPYLDERLAYYLTGEHYDRCEAELTQAATDTGTDDTD